MNLDAPLPAELGVGAGTALFVHGTCFDPERVIRKLSFILDGQEQPVSAFGMPRLDHFRALHPRLDPYRTGAIRVDPDAPEDPRLHSYRSGFWGLVRIGEAPPGGSLELGLRAALEGGSTASALLGEVRVAAPPEPLTLPFPGPEDQPRVAICMATHDPPLDLLARQLDSIRAQTHSNWVCVISDDCSRPDRFEALRELVGEDPRFAVSRSQRRLGFYANFERALQLAPRGCDYVALADQDDAWHPDKLTALLSSIGGAQLVYSDARIIGRGGELIASTYWARRRNNHTDLDSLLVANSVTGAASLFRRPLLHYALPFPPGQFAHYHDHWLALTALATGGIEYVDRPLYDYVQHGSAAIGHAAATRVFTLRERARKLRTNRGKRAPFYRATYFRHVERLMAFATILLMRCDERLTPSQRCALERFLALEQSWWPLARLSWLAARELTGEPETLGAEWMLLRALLWRRVLSATARGRPNRRVSLDSLPPADFAPPAERRAIGDAPSRALAERIAPLALTVSPNAPPRVNLLIPADALERPFGEHLASLALAARLASRGARVRVVAADPVGERPREAIRGSGSSRGAAEPFSQVEVEFAHRAGELEVNPRDAFLATTWSTAHLAARAVEELDRRGFVYLIQAFEPLRSSTGSYAALADASYRLEHFGLFSSELLREYFRAHRLGVFVTGSAAGDERSASFENAISEVMPPRVDELRARGTRRLLFYAGSEVHAPSSMFEFGILAVARALEEGAFRTGWELRGIGAGTRRRIDLGGDVEIEFLPSVPAGDFGGLLAGQDVGLALSYAPNPHLVSIEMAAAGMLSVTNTFENKTREALEAISSNLIAAPATIDAVAGALVDAAAAVGDVERRVAGAAVNWSRRWTESFDDQLVERVASQLFAP